MADRVEPEAFVEELRPVVFVGDDEYPIGSVAARRLGGREHDGARDPSPAVLLERVDVLDLRVSTVDVELTLPGKRAVDPCGEPPSAEDAIPHRVLLDETIRGLRSPWQLPAIDLFQERADLVEGTLLRRQGGRTIGGSAKRHHDDPRDLPAAIAERRRQSLSALAQDRHMAVRESFAAQDVVRQRREPIARERSFVAVNEEEVGHVPLRVVVVEVRDAALERLRAGAEQRVTTAFEREEAIDVAHPRTLPRTCPRRSTRELGPAIWP